MNLLSEEENKQNQLSVSESDNTENLVTADNDSDDDGLRVSLMPSDTAESTQLSFRKWVIVILAIIVIEVVGAGVGYLYLSNLEAEREKNINAVRVKITETTQNIAQMELTAKEVARFDTKARVVNELLDNHLYWTNFFEYLESKSKVGVSFLNFSGDVTEGTIVLDAIGRTYRDVAEQIVAFREAEMVEEVISTSASAQIGENGELGGVAFSLVIKINPTVWLKEKESDKETSN